MDTAITRFCDFYASLAPGKPLDLDSIYHSEVEFCDPVQTLRGRAALSCYFDELMTNLNSCRFIIESPLVAGGEAYLRWHMYFSHPRLQQGKLIEVPGISHLRFEQKVYYHRDYYDLGSMLYEHIPLLGSVVTSLKQRLVAA